MKLISRICYKWGIDTGMIEVEENGEVWREKIRLRHLNFLT